MRQSVAVLRWEQLIVDARDPISFRACFSRSSRTTRPEEPLGPRGVGLRMGYTTDG